MSHTNLPLTTKDDSNPEFEPTNSSYGEEGNEYNWAILKRVANGSGHHVQYHVSCTCTRISLWLARRFARYRCLTAQTLTLAEYWQMHSLGIVPTQYHCVQYFQLINAPFDTSLLQSSFSAGNLSVLTIPSNNVLIRGQAGSNESDGSKNALGHRCTANPRRPRSTVSLALTDFW